MGPVFQNRSSDNETKLNFFMSLSRILFFSIFFVIAIMALFPQDWLWMLGFLSYQALLVFSFLFMMIGVVDVNVRKTTKGMGFAWPASIIIICVFSFFQFCYIPPVMVLCILIIGFIFIPLFYFAYWIKCVKLKKK